MFNKEQGITLVALVITVIILLILAAVAVSMIAGNDGLFSKANDAGYRYNEASLNEAEKINELMEIIDGNIIEETAPEDADVAIKTASEFIAFRDSVNAGNTYKDKKIYLIGDIDLSSIDNFEPVGTDTYIFEGTFDGNYHTITGLKMNSAQYANLALFSQNKGTIQNLIMNNSVVENTYVGTKGNTSRAASIVGLNTGTISQCASLGGNISNIGTSVLFRGAGGIVGENKGFIEKCYNTSYVIAKSGYAGTSAYGQAYSGGIAGLHDANEIKECYNLGKIEIQTSDWRVAAGIAGILYAKGTTIKNCYNIGNINILSGAASGTSYIGGIVGCNGTSGLARGTITNCYYTTPTYISYEYNSSYRAVTTPTASSEDTMKSDTVLTALGDAFERGKDGYPILTWQKNIK